MIENLTFLNWLVAYIAIFILGIAKSGLKGMGLVIVTAMVFIFGSRPSTGIILPLLIFGDLFSVIYYRKHIVWKHVFKLFPWMILGIISATYLTEGISLRAFTIVMSILILVSTVMLFWFDLRKTKIVPKHPVFGISMGILAGIATMLGNLAGAFSNLYFIAMRLPKNILIGSAAWLYLIINSFKVPFHIFVWKTIHWESLTVGLYLLPAEIIGLFLGVRIVKRIKNEYFTKYILVMSALGALALLSK